MSGRGGEGRGSKLGSAGRTWQRCLMRSLLPLLFLIALSAAGCSPRGASSQQLGMSDDAILRELAVRVDAAAPPISTSGPVVRKMDYLVRHEVDGRSVACGYSSRWESSSSGEARRVGWPTIFIAGEELILREDVTPAEFSALQDRLCGPDWVGETVAPPPLH